MLMIITTNTDFIFINKVNNGIKLLIKEKIMKISIKTKIDKAQKTLIKVLSNKIKNINDNAKITNINKITIT